MLGLSLLLLLFSHSVRSTLLGWVESPGYPNGYVPHASLNWSRCAPRGHTLSIRLIHLDVEDSKDCENDAVRVFSNGNLISVLCGKKEFEELQATVNPSLISSSGGCLSLSFQSDYSNIQRHTGFRGFYSVQDYDECEDDPDNKCTQFCHNFIGGYYCSCRLGYYLDKDKHTCTVSCSKDLSGVSRGDISSPSWPGSYAENANCLHTLSVESHLQLELQFNEVFDVEQSSDGQCIDTLKIETPSGILGSFCGKTPPPSPFLTHSHHVKIRFTSDGFGSNKGFSFRFQTREKVCLAEVIPHSTVTPQRPQYRRGDIVTVTCDLGHVPNTKGVKTLSSEYETTCHSTGVWVPHYPCEPVDCGVPDIPEDGVIRILGDNQRTHYEDQIQFTCNSQYYTLEGNDTYTCSSNGEWVSSRGKTEMPKCTPICGIPTKALDLAGRILGGERAKLGEIPWHLFIKEPSRGGATLINDRWAVTAAHVVEHTEETSLRLYGGLVDGSLTQNPQSPNLVVMESERIIIHPGYAVGVDERANFDNDIALIRLASRVNFGPNLLPICLPAANRGLLVNEQGTISGWGLKDVKHSKNLALSRVLQYAHIGVYSLEQCEDTPYMSDEKRMIFTNNMFCAGADGKDSCQFDSGGPFVLPMLTSSEKPFYLTGIVSWGSPCQERRYKGYYTKVENYVDWIKETIRTVDSAKI
uniref:Complement component 1S n=1 Tax=Channa striata TaxID=64152 RepID=A0A376A949_CHASR|nr:Complement component 1S [Channa striata]